MDPFVAAHALTSVYMISEIMCLQVAFCHADSADPQLAGRELDILSPYPDPMELDGVRRAEPLDGESSRIRRIMATESCSTIGGRNSPIEQRAAALCRWSINNYHP